MNKKNGPLGRLKEITATIRKNSSGPQKNNKLYYVLILVLAGAALMIISDMWKDGKDEEAAAVINETAATDEGEAEAFSFKKGSKEKGITAQEEQLEVQLKDALDQIVGVEDASVVVNLEAAGKTIYEKNEVLKNQTTVEEDKEGGTRKIEDQSTEDHLVLIKEGDREVPIILENRKPEVQGVLVVAGGAENIQVKKWIIEAVTRGLDVPSHKVAVMPKKSKGE